jgi:hypothetical protein
VGALRAFDADRDGRLDIVFAGSSPTEIVVLRQTDKGEFETANRRRVKDLAATQLGLWVADVVGNEDPEVLAIAGGTRAGLPVLRRRRHRQSDRDGLLGPAGRDLPRGFQRRRH